MNSPPIEILNLNKKAFNILKLEKIETVGQLLKKTDLDLLKLPNMGKTTLNIIINSLKEIGYDLTIEVRKQVYNRPRIRLQIPMQEWQINHLYDKFKYKIDYETFKKIKDEIEKSHHIQ